MSTPLPGILADIAELVGEDAALMVARAGGGRRVYIPKPDNLKPGHWLVDAVGLDKAHAIADAIGGGEVDLPLGPAGSRGRVWRTIRTLLAEGKSVATVARLVGVDDATVWRHKAELAGRAPSKSGKRKKSADGRQHSLL